MPLMDLAGLESRSYGPAPWTVAFDAVSDYVDVTGGGPNRWVDEAPPGFAAAALFSVAPDLLAELYDRSVIHGEQSFEWAGPISVGDVYEVRGEVARVRERAGVFFISFEIEVGIPSNPLIRGRSLFLASGQSIPGGAGQPDRGEPPHSFRGDPEEGQVSASRADLIRYAAATRDWNPVHWDHEAGVAAGLGGVVVHGLLQAGWALQAASHGSSRAIRKAKFRFRNPMYPARPANVTLSSSEGDSIVVLADPEHEILHATIGHDE